MFAGARGSGAVEQARLSGVRWEDNGVTGSRAAPDGSIARARRPFWGNGEGCAAIADETGRCSESGVATRRSCDLGARLTSFSYPGGMPGFRADPDFEATRRSRAPS